MKIPLGMFLTISITLVGCSARLAAPSIGEVRSGLLSEQLDGSRLVPPANIVVPTMHQRGVDLTKQSEGWRPRLYDDPAGYCTIGYGHLIKKSRCNGTEPDNFLAGLNEPAGEALLRSDLVGAQVAVLTYVTVPLSELQHASLSDFVFNVGAENFRTSTLLKRVNTNNLDQVPTQLRRWVKANGRTLPGLVVRRDREIELFFDGAAVPKSLPSEQEDLSPIDVVAGE